MLHAPHPDGFKVWVASEATAANDANTIAEQDLRQAETIGILAALVILIMVFGTLAAAVVPIVLAIMAIMVALGIVSLLGLAFHLSFFITNMVTMIGLAVGIDYSLFTVSRYRVSRYRVASRSALANSRSTRTALTMPWTKHSLTWVCSSGWLERSSSSRWARQAINRGGHVARRAPLTVSNASRSNALDMTKKR